MLSSVRPLSEPFWSPALESPAPPGRLLPTETPLETPVFFSLCCSVTLLVWRATWPSGSNFSSWTVTRERSRSAVTLTRLWPGPTTPSTVS